MVNFNRGTVDPEVLFKLVQELHEDVQCAVVVTMPDPPPQLPFGFDGSWQAVRVVEPAACLVRVESTRGRPARTRLDFNLTIVGEGEHARSIVTHTGHRYHEFPLGWRDQHSLVLEALIMHVPSTAAAATAS